MNAWRYNLNKDPFEIHQRLLSKIRIKAKVLEIGCASGYLTRDIKSKECLVIGVEKDKTSGENARRSCHKLFIGDIEDIQIFNKISKYRFNQIVLADILEHLKDPETMLKRLVKLLKPGGEIIISIPNIAFLTVRLNLLLGRFDYTDSGIMDKTHLRFFTKASISKLVKNTGLKIVTLEGVTNLTQLPLYFKLFSWISNILDIRKIEQKLGSFWLEGLSVQFLVICKKKEN